MNEVFNRIGAVIGLAGILWAVCALFSAPPVIILVSLLWLTSLV